MISNFFILIILMIPSMMAYPGRNSDALDRFLNSYFRERSMYTSDLTDGDVSNEENIVRRQSFFPMFNTLQHQQQNDVQPACLPSIWTCGPDLPPCCPGLMCYDGNAKRGRHCIARG